MIPVVSDPESLTPATGGASETFDPLADHRRRTVLRALAEADAPLSLAALADRVAAGEDDRDRGAVADWGDALLGRRRRVLVSLRHVHVPKLADAGAVSFDRDANVVTLRETGARLLDRADGSDAADR